MLELTKEQQKIQDSILDWVSSGASSYIAVSGYAGTGKTTVLGNTAVRLMKEFPGISLKFLTFTGKASMVLSQKLKAFNPPSGIIDCGTIHSYLYYYLGRNIDTFELDFTPKCAAEIDGDILVVDEASMISTQIFTDLLRLDRPIIFVGDPGQLPPINDSVFQPLVETELSLSEVHRQALDNPIIKLATKTRNGEKINFGVYQGKVAKFPARSKQGINTFSKFQQKVGEEDTVVLCGMNRTRVALNKRIRAIQNLVDNKPIQGERLVCLKNDKAKDLVNGQCVYVKRADVIFDKELPDEPIGLNLVVQPEGDTRNVECIAYAGAFHNHKPNALGKRLWEDRHHISFIENKYKHLGDINLFDYGYTLSVHKSQGSEWERVVLRDERMGEQTDEDYYRWLYTGITRAKDRLLILSNK